MDDNDWLEEEYATETERRIEDERMEQAFQAWWDGITDVHASRRAFEAGWEAAKGDRI